MKSGGFIILSVDPAERPCAVIVVTGPPGAGKSTLVRAEAAPRDLVVDFDLIAGALLPGGRDGHAAGPGARRIAAAMWAAALRHLGKPWPDLDRAWLIHACPTERERDRYAELGWTVRTVDPGRAEVDRRLAADPAGRDPDQTAAYLATWYGATPTRAW